MRFFLLAIGSLVFLTFPAYSQQQSVKYEAGVYPFDIGQIQNSINLFAKGPVIFDDPAKFWKNEDEYSSCNLVSNDDTSIERNVLNKVLSAISKDLIKKIQLFKCSFESDYVAYAPSMSIYFDAVSSGRIIKKYGQLKARKIIAGIMAHEVGHLIHEYTTQEGKTKHTGISFNGTASHYTKEEFVNMNFCTQDKANWLLANSLVMFSTEAKCRDFTTKYGHYEVDAIGIKLFYTAGFKNPEFLDEFLLHMKEETIANEHKDEFYSQMEDSEERNRLIQSSITGFRQESKLRSHILKQSIQLLTE